MSRQRLFLDTYFVQALLNKNDTHYQQARQMAYLLREPSEVWTTEAVLVEVGNALSGFNRIGAVAFIRSCYTTKNLHLVPVDHILLQRAIDFYARHQDKEWGLTDCISFIVMRDNRLIDALTGDHHFRQAGFRSLME